MTSTSKLKREFLACLEYSRQLLAEQVKEYRDAERVFKGAALTLYYVEKYAQMIGYDMQPVDMERAVYVGGLIDPYDSTIDQGTIDDALVACTKFFRVLNTGEFRPGNHRETVFVDLYTTLTEILPPKDNQNFYDVLATMHMVESVAILQKKGSGHIINRSDPGHESPLCDETLRQVMKMKGGLSLLLFSALIDDDIRLKLHFDALELESPTALKQRIIDYASNDKALFDLQTPISKLVYSMGNYIQAMDDLRDVEEDAERDIETFTQRAGTLKALSTARGFRKQIANQAAALFNRGQGNIFLMYADFYFARTIGIALKREMEHYAGYLLKVKYMLIRPFQVLYNGLMSKHHQYFSEDNYLRKHS